VGCKASDASCSVFTNCSIVDDDDMVSSCTRAILKTLNYKVFEAANGIETMACFVREKGIITLIIMDVVMPRLGGVKATYKTRKVEPDAKVVFSTGYDKGEAQKGEVLGANIVLSKPFNVSDLSRVVCD